MATHLDRDFRHKIFSDISAIDIQIARMYGVTYEDIEMLNDKKDPTSRRIASRLHQLQAEMSGAMASIGEMMDLLESTNGETQPD